MKYSPIAISAIALLIVSSAYAKKAGSSDYVVVVGWDAQNNKLTYTDSKTGADASELHVRNLKSIEWQPASPKTQDLTIDFSGGSDSPFAASETRRGHAKGPIFHKLRQLRSQEQSARYKYSVTLTDDDGSTHNEDPIIIIEH
ncbi:MAG TPA: hypothetical protein VMJ34_03585 [Bryobacteraceae bacterium]|nr:hypothetical protein [Bryobacteraceae bacterium]